MYLLRSLIIHVVLLAVVATMLYVGASHLPTTSQIALDNISVNPGESETKKTALNKAPELTVPSISDSETTANQPLSGSGIPVSEMQKYLSEVMNRINRVKEYPKDARIKEQEGIVELLVEVAPDGKILGTKLSKPSSFESLNQAAILAVQKLGTLPPLPLNSAGSPLGEPIELHIPMQFQLL